MELRPGYKRTEVGVIPEEWEVKLLALIAEKIMVGIASAATHAYRAKGVPLLRNQNIKAGYLDDRDILFVDPEYETTFRNKRLRGGDLLTSRTGYPGITCIVPPCFESAQSFTTLITRPKTMEIDSSYLCHFINSEEGQRFFEQGQIGGAQKNVNAGTLRGMPIPVPSLPEQYAIAGVLSDVDELLGAMDQLIAKKRDLKQATMQQLLTGQTRLPGFSGKWEVRPIGSFSAFITKGSTPTTYGFNWEDGGVLFLRSECVSDNGLDLTQSMFISEAAHAALIRGEVRSGDILITITGNVGRVVHLKPDFGLANINQHIARIRVKDPGISPDFVCHWLSQPIVRAYYLSITTGQAYPQISLRQVRETHVPFPLFPEQAAIAEVLSDMDAELAALEQRRDKTRALKQGMMQELLTGRTRLV
ncbi:MAG: restriction endonuclease subunit S [Nitrospirota bacterium]